MEKKQEADELTVEIARAGYESYFGGLKDNDFPGWNSLDVDLKEAWCSAAEGIVIFLSKIGKTRTTDYTFSLLDLSDCVSGLTVKQLKKTMEWWPEEDIDTGEDCEVWITTRPGLSSQCRGVTPLNKKHNSSGFSADLLLEV